ncbi:AAA domain-containing protein [Bosea sp. 62]|uniref:DNA helicase n=1 Tax=unclassified Bosea (in: a-proteobacteria) TaxID=2653178 RepID=UPI00125A2E8E|nr:MULTISPECIES: DNA helicase [unclassified Bosea (in: a-proteobacteria)]CAD5263340.1 AAA domain-containing protein [Bosea sp. 46]CAD5265672.1 AAA domain-containing protein [Bosea sp. 21B]CAD5274122.1 AAA domain-containing protein [Bosea sp. 7B]VVT56725.1 AAA domain-containing protein [Bosea sp. EC-HK365B]VXB76441.1 AAA domain-containing protein [Bosea sp. 29B]
MKLSAPVYRLKRKAKELARKDDIPLHLALDRVAVGEGFGAWSLLASKSAESLSAEGLLVRLMPGDLLLIGARPGHGKTLLSLQLAVEAMKAGRRALFFTLEYTARDVLGRFRALGVDPAQFEALFSFDDSEAISADHIMRALAEAPRGTLAIVDYLQLLDQKRGNPELGVQISALKAFAEARGVILAFISQIDRSYDPALKPCPDLSDIRLPNPLDLSLFSKSCFLNEGEVRFQAAS